MNILNNGEPTHYSSAHGSHSAIDLSLCTADISPLFQWEITRYGYGSDHYPIHIKTNTPKQAFISRIKWKMDEANWEKYQEKLIMKADPEMNGIETIKYITERMQIAAKESIPQSGGKAFKKRVPWWNQEVKEAIYKRRKALKKFQLHPTHANHLKYKSENAKTRRVIRESKKRSWTEFTSSINRDTPIGDIFRKVRAIQGCQTSLSIPILKKDNMLISNPPDVVEILASQYEHTSSNINYSDEFKIIKDREESIPLNITELNHPINTPITICEFDEVLSDCRGSSPGPDQIHYEMIKNMKSSHKQQLLSGFNKIWSDWTFPEEWRMAYIVPIPKPGKDTTEAINYRPISLTSCLCKFMERIVNKRLQWFLEKHKIIDKCQAGFRRGRSTNDNLYRLNEDIRGAFERKEHLTAVFFDIQKAYDTTWRNKIIKLLMEAGLNGNIIAFICNFFKRTYIPSDFWKVHVSKKKY